MRHLKAFRQPARKDSDSAFQVQFLDSTCTPAPLAAVNLFACDCLVLRGARRSTGLACWQITAAVSSCCSKLLCQALKQAFARLQVTTTLNSPYKPAKSDMPTNLP